MSPTPVPSQRSALGVAKDVAKGQLSASVAAAGTSLTLTSVVGTFAGTGFVTVYSGANTETVSVSAWTAGTKTLTVGALVNPHAAGDLVVVTLAANAPTDFLPVTNQQQSDNISYLADNGYRGSFVNTYGMVSGPTHGEFDLGGDVIPDAIGYALAGILGDVATSGASAPFTHVMAALNSGIGQPPSYTFTDVEPVQARAMPGCLFTDLSLKIDAQQLLTWTAKLTGFTSGPAVQPTTSFSSLAPLPAFLGSTTVGGVYTPRLDSGQIDFKRAVTVQNTAQGNAAPYKIWVGPLEVTGKLTFVYEDETDLANYLNNVQPVVVLDWQSGAAAALVELKLQMSKAVYTAGSKNRGKDMLTTEVNFTALANTTDAGASGGYSPIKVTLKNAKPSGTYV